MTFKKTFVISIVSFALSASAFAMSHRESGRGHDRDDDRREHRPVAYHVHGGNDHDRDDRRPAGWDKGHKEGWGNRDMPPGLAKKHHRRDWDRDHDRYRAHHHRRDWDRDRDRRAVLNRPAPIGTRPVTQQDRNRAWGDNVRARKAEIKQQQAQTQGSQPYIKH